MHVQRRARSDAFMYNFNRGQYGKPRADASVRRRSRRRSGCGGCTSSGSGCATRTASSPVAAGAARRALPRARACSAAGCTGKRDRRSFWYLRSADVHDDAAAHLLPELQVRRIAGAGARRQRRARGARPRLLLPLELLGVGRVGRARPGRRLGDRSPRSSGRETRQARHARRRAADASGAGASRRRCSRSRSFRCSATGRRRRAPGRHDDRATSRAICSTPSSRTACSSPSATTTPSRSGTRRKSKASASDVVVANTSLLNTDWYARQLIRAPGSRVRRGARARRSTATGNWTKPIGSAAQHDDGRGRRRSRSRTTCARRSSSRRETSRRRSRAIRSR